MLLRKNYRHTRMDLGDEFIGLARDKRASSQLLVSGWVFPSFPQAGERKNSAPRCALLVFMLYRRCKTLPPACRPMAGAAPFGAGWRAGDSWGSGPRQLGVSWVNCPHV